MALPPMTHYAKAAATVLTVVALALVLLRLRSVALLVFLGFFLASGVEPLVRRLERQGMRRGVAVLVLVLAGVLLFVAGAALLLTPAIRQAGDLVQALPQLLDELSGRIGRLGTRLDDPALQDRLQGLLDKIPGLLAASLGTLYGILGGIAGAAFGLFTVAALTIYFMLAMPRIHRFAARALGRPERVAVMEQSLDRVGGYVTGQLTVSLIAGVVSGIVLTVMGVPYAAILGVAVAFFSAIPQVGALISAVVCTAVALTESVGLGLATFGFLVLYQQFENYVLVPRVFAKAVDLSPIAVFIAVLIGAAVAGAIGALTALPVTAALKVVFRYVFREQLERMEAPAPAASLPPSGDASSTPSGDPSSAPFGDPSRDPSGAPLRR